MERKEEHNCDALLHLVKRGFKEYLNPSEFNTRKKNELRGLVTSTTNINIDVTKIILSYLVNSPYVSISIGQPIPGSITAIYHERLNSVKCGNFIQCTDYITTVATEEYNNNTGIEYFNVYNTLHIYPPRINGKLHGKYEKYHENGRLAKVCYYIHGKLHGDCWEWQENGRPKSYKIYRRGKLVG